MLRIKMKTAFFWVITQRVVVIALRRLGVTYRSHLQGAIVQKCLEDGTDTLSINVGKELPLPAA
jgi:hypothetical protein